MKNWIVAGLLAASAVFAATAASAGCCCGRHWTYYPGEWSRSHVRAGGARQPQVRYHYPTWKFDRVAGEWRRLSP